MDVPYSACGVPTVGEQALLGNANVATMLRIRAEQAWARIGQVPYCSHEPRAAADEEAAGRQ